MKTLAAALLIVLGLSIGSYTVVSAGEPYYCEKGTTDPFPKVIDCLGIDYYASHQAIGLTAAMLLEHRCGSNPSADGYEACRDALLREVVAAYQRMASDPRW